MKNFIITSISLLIFICAQNVKSQPISGAKTIPGDYASISSAINALNTNGVGSGGVTFNVTAGYTESTSAQLTITATGTTTSPIIFQKSGSGTNPKITRTDAGTKTTTSVGGDGDGIIQFYGTDYIVFDGIDVQAIQSTIEYGFYTYKPSGTDGCQNDTIRNCSVTLIKSTVSNINVGIYISNGPTSLGSNTGVTVSNYTGRNENIVVCGDSIINVNHGVYVSGYKHTTAPYDYYDQNIKIGISGSGNTIQNFSWSGTGGSTFGIYSAYCNNFNASYNSLFNTAGGGEPSLCWFYGIFSSYTKAANTTYSYNTLSLTTSGTRLVYAIGNNAGDSNSTFNIHNNIIENCVIGNSGGFSAINNGVSSVTLNIYSNLINNNTINNGASTLIAPGSVDSANVYNNTISNNIVNSSSGTCYGFLFNSGVVNAYNNNISNYSTTTGTAKIEGISISNGTVNLYNNIITGINCNSLGESLIGIKVSGGVLCNIHRNKIHDLSGTVQSIYGISIQGGATDYVYNNLISDLRLSGVSNVDAIRGISITSSTVNSAIGIYYNTIYLKDTISVGENYGTSCIYHAYSSTGTTASLDMRNNIFVNHSKPNGTGKTVVFRRSGAGIFNNINISNNNCFYAGTPGINRLIYTDSTNNLQTLTEYKALITPKDSLSISTNPPFINVITPPYNLHLNSPSQCDDAGLPITTPISILFDYDSIPRHLVTPDLGAYERIATGINESINLPQNYILEQNYPNPFNPVTNIQFSIPQTDNVTLKIYNMQGKEVESYYDNSRLNAGTYIVSFNGAKLSSGVYFCKLESARFLMVKKMVLIK
ncbi:MAG: T9SS type A sorting domain-containing protein [Ignavibacteria bacterium]